MHKVVASLLVVSLGCAGCLATEAEPADAAEEIGEAQEQLAPIVIALLGAAVGAAATAGAAVYLADHQAPCPACPPCPSCPPVYVYPFAPYPSLPDASPAPSWP